MKALNSKTGLILTQLWDYIESDNLDNLCLEDTYIVFEKGNSTYESKGFIINSHPQLQLIFV